MMSVHKVLIFTVISLCTTINIIDATDFLNCTSNKPPISLEVKNCDSTPCKFIRGQNATMTMDFEVDHDVNTLTASVLAHLTGSEVPYPLPQPDACLGLIDGECPLDDGEEVTYVLKMPVLKSFPKVEVLIEFYLKDENNNVIVCFKLGAEVVDN